MKKLLLLLLSLSGSAFAVGSPVGYVQISNGSTQPGGFNTSTGTVANAFSLPYIAGTQCLQETNGIVSGTGLTCAQNSSGVGSTLAIASGPIVISSPTAILNFNGNDFLTAFANGATTYVLLNPSTTDFIHNQSTLQSGATAYPDFIYVGSSFTSLGPVHIYGKVNIGNDLSGPSAQAHFIFDPSTNNPIFELQAGALATVDDLSWQNSGGIDFGTIRAFPFTVGGVKPPLTAISPNGFAVTYGLAVATFTTPSFNTTSTSATVTGPSGLAIIGGGGLSVSYGASVATITVSAGDINFGTPHLGLSPNSLHMDSSGAIYMGTGINVGQASAGDISIGLLSMNSSVMSGGLGDNIAMGIGAMEACTAGPNYGHNIAIGENALLLCPTAPLNGDNIAIGLNVLSGMTGNTAVEETAVGALALQSLSSGNENAAFGYKSLNALSVGLENSGIGAWALSSVQGSGNVGIGHSAGGGGDVASNNTVLKAQSSVFVGYKTATSVSTDTVTDGVDIGANSLIDGLYSNSIGEGNNTTWYALALGNNISIASSATASIGTYTGGTNEYTVYMSTAIAHSITAQGGPIRFTSKTKAQFAAMTPLTSGEQYYCSDCTALTMCVSTGTTQGAWASPTSKTTACN